MESKPKGPAPKHAAPKATAKKGPAPRGRGADGPRRNPPSKTVAPGAAAMALSSKFPPCEKCGKPGPVCICDRLEVMPSKVRVVILQHPQEEDVVLGTAKLVALSLEGAEIIRGITWSSLDDVLGVEGVDKTKWAVLAAAKLPEGAAKPAGPVMMVDRNGQVMSVGRHKLEGILVLDGTWSQAKTLWWRNAWLLKHPRIALTPREPGLYGRLREEPRRDWVSTLEAVADVLPALGDPESTRDQLRRLMRTMLQRARDAVNAGAAPKP